MQTITEWLSESIGSHDIADAEALMKDYALCTGHIAKNWPTHSPQETKRAIEARGLGGSLTTDAKKLAYGWQVAETLALQYAGFRTEKVGRGSAYRECVEALKAKGL
jgi:hypothetical protein